MMNSPAPVKWTEPHEELLDSEGALPPGDAVVSRSFLLSEKGFAFKAFSAERVKGVDYGAFKIHSVWVGQSRQWGAWAGGEFWPATDLFKKWDASMDAVQGGLSIMIQLRNESDKPQRFAVKLVGKRL